MKEQLKAITEQFRAKLANNEEAITAINEVEEAVLSNIDKYAENTLAGTLSATWYSEYAPTYGGGRSMFRSGFAAVQRIAGGATFN